MKKRKFKLTKIKAKKISYNLLACSFLFGILLLVGLRSPDIYVRFYEAIRDFGVSFAGLFSDKIAPTVSQLPQGLVDGFPKTWSAIAEVLRSAAGKLFTTENLLEYAAFLATFFMLALTAVTFFLTFVALPFGIFLVIDLKQKNHRLGKLSKPLRAFLRIRDVIWIPFVGYCSGFRDFLRKNKVYKRALIALLLFSLNVYTIGLEFFAWYYTFDFIDVGVQAVKLLYDLFLVVALLPWWLWIFVVIFVIAKWRRFEGYRRLKAHEEKFRKFIGSLNMAVLFTGPMRTGKTTLQTSAALSYEKIFRRMAKDGMREIDLKFPNFPWLTFQKVLERERAAHKIFSLATARKWAAGYCDFHKRIANDPGSENRARKLLSKRYKMKFDTFLFGYDSKRWPMVYDRGLGIEHLYDAIYDYAQLYIVFTEPSISLSNYSIRFDDDLETIGNDVRRKDDFFKNPKKEKSLFSHIVHYDMFRLGKKMNPNDPYNNAFEFGIASFTELAKERGNQYDRAGKSVNDSFANILNDMFNIDFKMRGHSAEIYYNTFIRILGDEQRPSSLNADLLQNMDIVQILKKSDEKIVLPFFAFGEALYALSQKLFGKIFDEHVYNHGDSSLSVWILHNFIQKKIFDHYQKVRCTFGGYTEKLWIQDGMQIEKARVERVFIPNQKVFLDRFRTDNFKDYYNQKSLRSKTGIGDVPMYRSTKQTMDENRQQGAYLYRELDKFFVNDPDAATKPEGDSHDTDSS